MRKALIVGIDYYLHLSQLRGCVDDSHAVKAVLGRHADGTVNFATPKILAATSPIDLVKRDDLRDAVRELFTGDAEIALLYFAGHGHIDETGGFLCASDTKTGHDGLSLADVMTMAVQSNAKNRLVVLDSCHSGVAGNQPASQGMAHIKEGMTVLTASGADQYALENGNGVFTDLFVDALNGAGANLVGDITPGSIYAHIDQSLGPWAQRPVFKTNVKTFVSLRKATPPLPLVELQALARHFPTRGYEFKLDPSFEPMRNTDPPNIPAPDPEKTAVFNVLQNYARVDLLRPVGVKHMWNAAMEGKSCKLTVVGEHYRDLVAKGLI